MDTEELVLGFSARIFVRENFPKPPLADLEIGAPAGVGGRASMATSNRKRIQHLLSTRRVFDLGLLQLLEILLALGA